MYIVYAELQPPVQSQQWPRPVPSSGEPVSGRQQQFVPSVGSTMQTMSSLPIDMTISGSEQFTELGEVPQLPDTARSVHTYDTAARMSQPQHTRDTAVLAVQPNQPVDNVVRPTQPLTYDTAVSGARASVTDPVTVVEPPKPVVLTPSGFQHLLSAIGQDLHQWKQRSLYRGEPVSASLHREIVRY
jgi:hypothetical protein